MGLTVEALLLELAKAVAPLKDELAAGRVEELFESLGLPASDLVLAAGPVTDRLTAAGTALDGLPAAATALAAAIEAGDGPGIASSVAQAVPIVSSVLTAIAAVATAVDGVAATAGGAEAEVRAFAAELPERLLGYLVATYLDRSHPVTAGVADLLGILERAPQAATANAPAYVRRSLRLDRLAPLLRDPVASLAGLYGWGTASFDWNHFLGLLAPFAGRVSSFAFVQPGTATTPPVLRIGLVDIGPTNDAAPGLQAVLRVAMAQPVEANLPIAPGLAVDIGLASAMEAAAAIELLPPAQLDVVPPTAEVSGQARVGVAVTDAAGGALVVLGTASGPRIEAKQLRLAVGADLAWDLPTRRARGDLLVEAAIEDGKVVISLAGADGFLSAILPAGGFSVDFDLLAGWSSTRGLYFEGGAALGIDIPVDFDLGPVKFQMLHLALGVSDGELTLEMSGAVSASLGPFALAVDRMGTLGRLSFPGRDGNLGPANLAMEFKPPQGIGLSLDAGVVKGGGYIYLDPAAGEYAGFLELAFGPVSIKALAILSTKLPDGSSGWALLLLVFGEFPPVQLSFGFTLNGVGGIIGLQHGVSIDALQSGLRTGALDAVLFPRDPVANAPTLIRQLRLVFPVIPRALTIGPALKLGWSTPALVTLSLGLVIQFDDVLGSGPGQPSISRVVLLGRLKVQIPPVDELGIDAPALIQLQVDVVGAYDANEKALSIDAVLHDSFVALLPITGSLVVRARFGAAPTFLMAVGGFHPRFHDLPPGIPPQDRVGFELRYGIAVVRVVGYFAITSNTVQTGAEAQLVASGGGFRVEAFIGFDALFVFEPVFHFEVDFRAGAAIRWHGHSLASVQVHGTLSGPGRWEISGSASFSILWWDVGIDFDVAWGSAPAPALPSVRVGPLIAAALSAPHNWTAQLPAGGAALVTLRLLNAGDDVLAHPLGEVVGLQKVAPLGIHIDRVGQSRPADGNQFDIATVAIGTGGGPPSFRDEHFARGEFLDLSEEDKLSLPSFENFRAGVAVSSSDYTVAASQIAFEPEWETVFLGESRPRIKSVLAAADLVKHAQFAAVATSDLRAGDRLQPAVKATVGLAASGFAVASRTDLGAGAAVPVGATFTEAAHSAATAVGRVFIAEVAELEARP